MHKKSISAIFLVAVAVAFAAYTKQNTRVDRIQMEPGYDINGAVITAKGQAFLQTKLLVNDSDPTDQVPAPWKPLNFDLLGSPMATTNYTAAGKTVNGTQLAALLRQAMLDEATRQGIQ